VGEDFGGEQFHGGDDLRVGAAAPEVEPADEAAHLKVLASWLRRATHWSGVPKTAREARSSSSDSASTAARMAR